MFSIFKFLNFKSDTDKAKVSNSLSGKTLNLNSPEGRALNIFSNKSPIAPKQNGNDTSLSSNNKETVTSPGFSYRITQRVHEMRSTIPNTDLSNMQTSFASDLNGTNTVNNTHTIPKDIYDKKRKLMESLDNFGVRKRTRQESAVDAFVYRRQRTINEFNSSDRITVINGHNHRSTQPTSAIIGSKSVNVENRKTKRHGDFGTTMCHLQKKPRTRNNEILSSYSSSKFLQTGQKRPHPNDHEGDSPNRKHCKSCTCCGSTMILEDENYQNNSNKNDKTTETDLSEDLVTFAASRIFNRSGKTQRVKKICMKTILDDVFEDKDPIPFTSIDKVAEKKKKAEENVLLMNQHTDKSKLKNSNQVVGSVSSAIVTTVINEIQPSVTSILSTASTLSVSSTTLTTPLPVQSTTPVTTGFNPPSKNITKTNGVNTNVQLNVSSSITSNEVDGKTIDSQASDSSNNVFLVPTNTEQSPNKHKLLFQPSEKNTNIINDKSSVLRENDLNSDKQSFQLNKLNKHTNNLSVIQSDGQNLTNKSKIELTPSLVFGNQVENNQKQSTVTFEVPKANEKQVTPGMQFGASKTNEKQSTSPLLQFGSPKTDEKQSILPVLQFGASKTDEKQSKPPVLQFGSPKTNEKQSTSPVLQFGSPKTDKKQSILPILQFGASKTNEKQSTSPVLQFGSPKTDEKQSILPVLQFGASKIDEKQSKPPVLQFGSPKTDEKQSILPVLQFGTSKTDEKQSKPPVLQFGSPKTDEKQSKPPVMQFGASKTDEKQTPPVMQFGSPKTDEKQSKPPAMKFGAPKTDEKQTTPIVQFGITKESENSTSTSSLFSFGNSQISSGMSKPIEPVKFNFSSLKPLDSTAPSTEPKNVFVTSNLQNQNLFKFGNTDNTPDNLPKYDANTEKPTSKLQFGTLSTPVFGTSNTNQPKPQFSTSVSQSIDNQGPKIVFGNLITENKPTTSASGMIFANSTNPVFQFNNSSSKPNEKPSEVSNNAFPFSSNKTVPTFGGSAPQRFGEKQSFQFNGEKKEESKTQFSTPVFGSPNTIAPFKFGDNDKPTSFGTTFNSNQPLQFTNNTEKTKEPFKFGAVTPTSNAFQFSANKTDNGPVKFGQASSTFPASGFSGFGNPAPQQTTAFGSVPSSQSSLFVNTNSATAAPTFGSAASSTNTFTPNQGFQFGHTNNAPNSSSTFAFGGNTQPTKPDGGFGFNAASTTPSQPFQFSPTPLPLSTSQFGGGPTQGSYNFGSNPMPGTGSSQPLFSMGTAPAGERKKAKAVRRRQ